MNPLGTEGKIKKFMIGLLDSNSATRLDNEGITVLNCYLKKGSRLIRSKIMSPPKLDIFIKRYYEFLDYLDG
jgi:hypothetical protein